MIVVNQIGIPRRPEIKPGEFSKAIGMPITAAIPFDAQAVGSAQTNGQMISEVAPQSKAAEGIASLAKSIAGLGRGAMSESRPSRSLLARLPFIGRRT